MLYIAKSAVAKLMPLLIKYPGIEDVALFPTHSTDIVMKECAAYGGVTARSQMEVVYESPQWIDNNTSIKTIKYFRDTC